MDYSVSHTLLIFLGAAIVMVPLVRKMGFSSVIGYILGGIIIGPFVLKFIGSDAEDIMHATEFGVVMLLFLVGLELEPKKFWAMRKSVTGLGFMQMSLTISILLLIFYLAGWQSKQALVVALSFAMSSTAIVLQTLKEKDLFNTAAGKSSFSILLFQDIAVIPILALIPWLATGAPANADEQSQLLLRLLPDWLQPFTVLVGVLVLILLGRYIFVPFLRYVSRSGMSELLTAAALFLVIGVSELMIFLGISAALGAFMAGVMLANSEFRHELESNINPFKGVLLAIFFVSVGSTINFNVVAGHPIFIASTVAVVMVVKFAVLFATGKINKLSNDQNFLLAFGLSQVGEFAFVLLSFAFKLYLLDPLFHSQMIAVVAISMTITPILLIINEKFIAPNFNTKMKEEEEQSAGDKLGDFIQKNKIIIVGFGHFGSTVGRLLKVNGIQATVLDHDSDRVSLLRSHGFKVYYGDATRIEMLRAAGAEEAEILVICLDDPEANKLIATLAQKNFPQLQVFVRAKNRLDAYDFINKGIDNIYRETLGTAVNMAVDIMQQTGMRRYAARRIAKRFIMIDKASTKRLAKEQLKEDVTFTVKESLEREAQLLADDNISFDTNLWSEPEN